MYSSSAHSPFFITQCAYRIALTNRKLEKFVEEFPASICKYKVLPALVQALDICSASYKAVVPVLRLGSTLTQEV